MKCLIFLIFASVALVAAGRAWEVVGSESLSRMRNDCINESGMTQKQIESMDKNTNLNEKEVRDYVLCFSTRAGFFTPEKGYIRERMIAQIEAMGIISDTTRDALLKCADDSDKNGDAAERAFHGFECMRTEINKGIQERR